MPDDSITSSKGKTTLFGPLLEQPRGNGPAQNKKPLPVEKKVVPADVVQNWVKRSKDVRPWMTPKELGSAILAFQFRNALYTHTFGPCRRMPCWKLGEGVAPPRRSNELRNRQKYGGIRPLRMET